MERAIYTIKGGVRMQWIENYVFSIQTFAVCRIRTRDCSADSFTANCAIETCAEKVVEKIAGQPVDIIYVNLGQNQANKII